MYVLITFQSKSLFLSSLERKTHYLYVKVSIHIYIYLNIIETNYFIFVNAKNKLIC